MKKMICRETSRKEIEKLLTKPYFDQVEVNEATAARIYRAFGEHLSAMEVAERVIQDIRKKGNEGLLEYTAAIDGVELTAESMEVSQEEIDQAVASVEPEILSSIRRAEASIRRFHQEQMPRSWMAYRENGAMVGQACIPLERVGIYVPGGTAAYPSSVLMNGVPASVAGVKEIIMAVPPARDGSVNPYVLAAAKEAGVHRIFKMGGAQAIGALAFGTETVPKVDKITGPGNIFVTLAKKAVYGYCDIDMLAGPSEILILADQTANPVYVAADLLSQAEHDTLASGVLITDSRELMEQVEKEVERQLALLPRQEIARQALDNCGMMVLVEDMAQGVELANISAPEHLEVLTADPFSLLPFIKHAGAIFLGPYSPEPLGDYMAGPNHVLPTGGTARFYSVLNVESFMKKSSIIAYNQKALAAVGEDIVRLAEAEGLSAHANAIRVRRGE